MDPSQVKNFFNRDGEKCAVSVSLKTVITDPKFKRGPAAGPGGR